MSEDSKELDVYEARQINKQYSDGYTSEVRNNNITIVFLHL